MLYTKGQHKKAPENSSFTRLKNASVSIGNTSHSLRFLTEETSYSSKKIVKRQKFYMYLCSEEVTQTSMLKLIMNLEFEERRKLIINTYLKKKWSHHLILFHFHKKNTFVKN